MIGSALTVMATVAGSYARFILHTTRLDQNHLSVAAVFPLVLIVLFLARPLKLSRGEMIVIFSMSLIGATMPTYFIGKLIANFAVPYYLLTPENQWREFFEPELPSYAVVPSGNALRWFFEGLPSGTELPWLTWITPVFWWLSVIAAFYGCCLFIMVMLRRQWVENERIDYPLMEMPLAIMEESDEKGYFRLPILNKPQFWFGYGITSFVILWNMISYFNPTFPTIPWRLNDIKLGAEFPAIGTRLYWMVVGFGYFINLDISFSLWFFNLLTNVEVGMFNRVGLDIGGDEEYSTAPLVMGVQSMGAFATIVGSGFWMARHHLRDVWRKAIHGDDSVDDSDEIVSYRTAVLGFGICAAYLFVWHAATGMEIRFIPLFLLGALIVYLGITRVIAETGLISIRAPLMPQPFAMFFFGTDVLTRETMVSIALSYSWCGDTKTTIMPALAHSTKLFSTIKHHQRSLMIGVVVAMALGVLTSFAFTIYMGYLHGAANYGGLFTGELAAYPWDNLVKKVKAPFPTKWEPLSFMFGGAAITAGLMILRYRFPAWPFHPIGFAAGPVYPVNNVIFPIFLAWAIKSIIVGIGGVKAYRSAGPFFIGLILGHFVGAGISFIADMIWFHGNGHGIPFSD
jgi:hypothetical protein